MSKIIIVGEGYPGILSALEFCDITINTIQANYPDDLILTYPLASGERGTVEVISHYLEGDFIKVFIKNRIESYFISKNFAFIEGSHYHDERSSNRWGLLIKDALNKGATTIYLALKNESFSDHGMGLFFTLGTDINASFIVLGNSQTIIPPMINSALKTRIIDGSKMIFDLAKVKENINDADLIIASTNIFDNGSFIDDSTSQLINWVQHQNIRLIILSNINLSEDFKIPGVEVYSLSPYNMPAEIAFKEIANNLRYTLIDLMREDTI